MVYNTQERAVFLLLIYADFVRSAYHLAPASATVCDYGQPVPEAQCESSVLSLAALSVTTWSTTTYPLQRGNNDACGSWGSVPLGCSAQVGSWIPHWKSGGCNNCCESLAYQLVCSGEAPKECRSSIEQSGNCYGDYFVTVVMNGCNLHYFNGYTTYISGGCACCNTFSSGCTTDLVMTFTNNNQVRAV